MGYGEGLYGRPPSLSAIFTTMSLTIPGHVGDHKGPPIPTILAPTNVDGLFLRVMLGSL